MQEKETAPKHSVRGYLSRQSTEKLEEILNDYLQQDCHQKECYVNLSVILMMLDILSMRFALGETSERYIRMKEKLLNDKPKKDDENRR